MCLENVEGAEHDRTTAIFRSFDHLLRVMRNPVQ